MHFHFTRSEAAPEVVELHVRMVGKQRHRDRRIDNAPRDHEGGEALAERIVVMAGVPD